MDHPYAWDYVLMAWPGVVMAIVPASLPAWRRTRTAGRVMGSVLAAAVIARGVGTIFDSWGPRRPYGWPYLAYGLFMIIGLIAVGRRPAMEKGVTTDVQTAPVQ
uniref:Uncharacterized protein n=2 Tax=Nonomuraea gerenzanensis TaxID=93944 RepID=A0A1M4EC65_9ACTN|nr:hypothetical protein BN4615_P5848 [Nonomuraea gerenzanensis]